MPKIHFQVSHLFYFIIPLVLFWVKDNVFFWDTIQLGSKQAHWYYENQFSQLLLPEIIDSGHPPAFGLYLAALWTIFGKSLFVSHMAMLPFLIGIVLFLERIGSYLGNKQSSFFLLCLFFFDPVIASQSVLISPDIVLMFFFLMGLWCLFFKQRQYLFFAALGLAMISMRGMMVVVLLYVFDVLHPFLNPNSKETGLKAIIMAFIEKTVPYIPSGLFALAFLIWHYSQTNWIGYHANSPWAASFEKIEGLGGLIRNFAVLGWRYVDFGRIFLWLAGGIATFILYRQKSLLGTRLQQLLLLLILSIVILSPSQLVHKYLVVHRYNIPGFIALTLLVYHLLFGLLLHRKRLVENLFVIALLGLISGNFWVYPKKISQGWDSTLAHLPYYKVRTEMFDYIEQKGIRVENIGTAFPEIGAFKYKDLSNTDVGFVTKDLDKQGLILYSNVMNDFTDEEIDALEQDWEIVQKFQSLQVYVILYKRKN